MAFTPPTANVDEILSSPLFAIGNVVQVQWGYAEFGLRTVYGVLTVPDVNIGESVEITLNANGLLYGLMRRSGQRTWRESPEDDSSTPYTALQIIADLAVMEFGFEVDITSASDAILDETPGKVWTQSGETNWAFMQRICDYYGCDMFLQGARLFVVSRVKVRSGSAPVAATFRFRGQLDMENNIFPMENFTAENMGVILGMQSRGFMMNDFNPDDPDSPVSDASDVGIVRSADPSRLPSDTGGVLGGAPEDIPCPFRELSGLRIDKAFNTERNESGAIVNVSSRDPGVAAFLNAQAEKSQLTAYEVEFETLGLPFIYPNQLIKVEGVGGIFDKVYFVQEVTHTLGSGYDMTIHASSSDVAIDSNMRSSAEATNNPDPPTSPDRILMTSESTSRLLS